MSKHIRDAQHKHNQEYPLPVCIAAILTTVLAILALEI